jgi:tRNA pseudouridine32 synthase/23S rRNA pseudouridine746 synthase
VSKRYVAVLSTTCSGARHHQDAAAAVLATVRGKVVDEVAWAVCREHGSRARGVPVALSGRTGPHPPAAPALRPSQGLGNPIKGDALYGRSADRLYLHAEEIVFTHPTTGERVTFRADSHF